MNFWFLTNFFETFKFTIVANGKITKKPMGLDTLLENQLGHWPKKSSRSCIYIVSFYLRGSNLTLSLLYGQRRLKYSLIFKIPVAIFDNETWPLAKVPEVAHIMSCYARGSKLSFFLLHGQRFPRYEPVFKVAIFGHETSPFAKVPEVAHSLSTQGVEIEQKKKKEAQRLLDTAWHFARWT